MRLASETRDSARFFAGNFLTTPEPATFRTAVFFAVAFFAAPFFATVVLAELFFAVLGADLTVLPTALLALAAFFTPVFFAVRAAAFALTAVRLATVLVPDATFFVALAFFAAVVPTFAAPDLPVGFFIALAATPLRAVLALPLTVEARFVEPVVREALALAAMNLFP